MLIKRQLIRCKGYWQFNRSSNGMRHVNRDVRDCECVNNLATGRCDWRGYVTLWGSEWVVEGYTVHGKSPNFWMIADDQKWVSAERKAGASGQKINASAASAH